MRMCTTTTISSSFFFFFCGTTISSNGSEHAASVHVAARRFRFEALVFLFSLKLKQHTGHMEVYMACLFESESGADAESGANSSIYMLCIRHVYQHAPRAPPFPRLFVSHAQCMASWPTYTGLIPYYCFIFL